MPAISIMAAVADRLTGEARTFVEPRAAPTLATIADDGLRARVSVCFGGRRG